MIKIMPCCIKTYVISLFLFTVSAGLRIKNFDNVGDEPISASRGIPSSLSIENLQLQDNTRRGRTTQAPLTKAPSLATTLRPIVEDNDVVLYRLTNSEGKTCILVSTDAIVQLEYVTKLKEKKEADVYVPSEYRATGECNDDDASFTISWGGSFAWTLAFSKTPGGDHWYLERMDLDVNTEDKHLEHINKPPTVLHFTTAKDHTGMLFPTPIGRAYSCDEETSVVLTEGDVVATLLLRKLKMQPFIFKNDQFGSEYVCTPGGAKAYRDETAPIAVGSTFAIVSVLTVVGYGVYRYVKVKKVQYDTME